ncbi:MAG: hypothetical protein F4X95_02430 [Oligoflexia bacterium]|nr:hypothetical protein [Oligoflexia bacterium]
MYICLHKRIELYPYGIISVSTGTSRFVTLWPNYCNIVSIANLENKGNAILYVVLGRVPCL